MKKIAFILIWVSLLFTSCYKFLEEDPKGFLTTSGYYQNKAQVNAAVNGLYSGLDKYLVGAFGVAESPAWALEYITGYCTRPNTGNQSDNEFLNLTGIDDQNGYVGTFWSNAGFFPIENCNSVIEIVPNLTFLTDEEKNEYLGQAYFLRAHYYFLVVRLFGDIPLKLETTKDLNDIQIPKRPIKVIYAQIVKDLEAAEKCNVKWADHTGRVSMGAIKSLLSEVYMTMAGYPLRGGNEYYQKAYEKAKEVIESKEFKLYARYSDLRRYNTTTSTYPNENYDEHIFMFQKAPTINENIIHVHFLPLNQRISNVVQGNMGGAMKPQVGFYNSYPTGDKRVEEQAYYYTTYPRNTGSGTQTFEPYIFKFWDAGAEDTKRSGANVWNIRYADILLLCAEAKTMVDGGSTTDAIAIDAYYEVRKRAMPSEAKPTSISFNDVFKERTWELCFELKAWFDIMRTRKIFNYENKTVVDVIGYTSPGRTKAFEVKDMLFPIPYSEKIANPLVLEDPVE